MDSHGECGLACGVRAVINQDVQLLDRAHHWIHGTDAGGNIAIDLHVSIGQRCYGGQKAHDRAGQSRVD